MLTEERPAAPAPQARGRRWTGALPVTAAILVLGASAALVVPGVRHQLALSFQRQPTHYVELYLADENRARSCPVDSAGTLRVVASVRSHLGAADALPYVVTVTGANGTTTARSDGVVGTTPGRVSDFGADVAVPTSAYTVQVALTGRSERLLLHCAGTTP